MWKKFIVQQATKYLERQAQDLAREIQRRCKDKEDPEELGKALVESFKHVLLHS